MRLRFPTALLLSACSTSALPPGDGALADCSDLACQENWLTARWDGDSTEIAAHLETMKAGPERLGLIRHLFRLSPPANARICEVLEPGVGQDWCRDTSGRPHLGESSEQVQRGVRPGGGPWSLTLSSTATSTFDPAVIDTSCPIEGNLELECYDQTARARATRGDAAGAAAACFAIEGEPWRSECFFASAEAASSTGDPLRYERASELCLASRNFEPQCQTHLISALAARAPRGDAQGETWATMILIAETIEASWAARDPLMGALARDRLWSEALHLAFFEVEPASGHLSEVLPPDATRHLHSALVARLLKVRPELLGTSLDDAVAVARGRLQDVPATWSFQAMVPPRNAHVQDLWAQEAPHHQHQPATFHLGQARRTWSADVEADLAIVLLETAARIPGSAPQWAEAGMAWPDASVVWTTERIGQHLRGHGPD